MGKASRRKKFDKKRRSGGAVFPQPTSRLNPAIVHTVQQNVIEIINQGRVLERALEIAASAFFLAEHLLRGFEAENTLPQPLACQEGCDACCHNLVELTPPEALLIGHHVHQYFPQAEKELVLAQVDKNLALAAGKTRAAIALMRRHLPCPLLHGHRCSIYPIRPLVCRAMHALDRERCDAELHLSTLAGSQYYDHRHEIALSVSAGILAGSEAVRCQSRPLNLTRALHDFFVQENCMDRWINGETVFNS